MASNDNNYESAEMNSKAGNLTSCHLPICTA